jgi:hypothetical protein
VFWKTLFTAIVPLTSRRLVGLSPQPPRRVFFVARKLKFPFGEAQTKTTPNGMLREAKSLNAENF